MTRYAQHVDLFIVGGGPAGLAAAIVAAQKGFLVMVADQCRPPIDKACGEGLMPDTVEALAALGVRFHSDETASFCGIRFRAADGCVSAESKFHNGVGVGVRRTLLHAKLVQRAQEAGVELAWGTRVTVLGAGEVGCKTESGPDKRLFCRWVIGADGESSQVRKWVNAGPARYEHVRFGYRQHFRAAPWTDFVEVYWARHCQVVAAPVAPDEICLAVTSRNRGITPLEALQDVPALTGHLGQIVPASTGRGARTALRRLHRVQRDRFALLGDASGSVDPITGEGLGLAFQQAAALVEAIQHGDLRRYQKAHDNIGKVPRLMSRLLLLMDAHPRFRDKVLCALAADQRIFSRLLNLHVSALPPSAFGVGNALRLGWRVAMAPGMEG